MEKYKYEYEDMQDYIIYYKESERCAEDLEKRTSYFEGAAKITNNISVNSSSLLPQGKNSGNENNKNEDRPVDT